MSWWGENYHRIQWSFAHMGGVGGNVEKTVFPGFASQLMVASAALRRLGADRRFMTRVLANPGEGGTVRLTLVGDGDPTLMYDDLLAMATGLHYHGIRAVQGPLWVDETLFDADRQGKGWFWDEESEPAQAQLSALSVNGNCAVVKVRPGETGECQVAELGRAEGYVRVVGDVGPGGHEGETEHVSVTRRRGSNVLELSGQTACATRIAVTVDEPALYAGHLFLKALETVGITTMGEARAVHGNGGGDCLAEHRSEPLLQVLSQNRPGHGAPLVYELLLKHLGTIGAQQGTGQRGLAVIDELMAPTIGTSYRLMDGAGLSRYNLFSADHLTRLLAYIAQSQPELVDLLPVGEHGRVVTYTTGSSAAGVLGYWGEELTPLALLAFGDLTGVTEGELLQAVEEELARQVIGQGGHSALAYPEVAAASATSDFKAPDNSLASDLDMLLSDPLLRYGMTGLHVVDLEDGRELYAHRPDALFTPASNTKLFTSAAALHFLGSDFRYQTPVHYRGERHADGRWAGDLVVKGIGDPTLDAGALRDWAEQLMQRGLRVLEGGVIVDDTAFSDGVLPHGWLSNLEPHGYSPQISALSFNENVVTVTLHPARRAGENAVAEISSVPGYLTLENRVLTVETSGDELVEISRSSYANHVIVTGQIPVGHEPVAVKVTVEDPSIFFGKALLDALIRAGVRVPADRSVTHGVVSEQDRLLFVHASQPLSKMVAELNKWSDNFIAEMLLSGIGLSIKGSGTAAAGGELVQQMLRSGGANSLPVLTDGSGLTRHNLITPRQITALLRQMATHSEFAAYYETLPVAGVDGTLTNRMKSGHAYGNLRAKTGTVSGVSALSGYVTNASGHRLCFAILMNGIAEVGAFVAMQNRIGERLAQG